MPITEQKPLPGREDWACWTYNSESNFRQMTPYRIGVKLMLCWIMPVYVP